MKMNMVHWWNDSDGENPQ